MSIEELIELLENYDVQCTFSHFKKPVTPPFMIYLSPSTNNFNADNVVYYVDKSLTLELYTRVDTILEENKLEDYLTKNNVLWDKTSQTWIDDEKVIMSVYELNV